VASFQLPAVACTVKHTSNYVQKQYSVTDSGIRQKGIKQKLLSSVVLLRKFCTQFGAAADEFVKIDLQLLLSTICCD